MTKTRGAPPEGYKFCSGPDCPRLLSIDEERANKDYCGPTCQNRARNLRKGGRPVEDPARSRAKWEAEKARLAAVKAQAAKNV